MKSMCQLFLVFGFLMAGVSRAKAHAFVDHAEPPVGSIRHDSPAQVKIWFTRKINPASSMIQVFDEKGNEVDKRDARLDPVDATLMVVSMPKLSTGNYKVMWKAVCLDTHTTHGDFIFEVN